MRAEDEDPDPVAPERLGRYTLLGVLGRGGMGVVHEALDEQVGRKVALKLLHAELRGRHAERLVREARALARLSHPNVVQVHETGRHPERWFIAMELVRGRTLRDWQRERPPWRECVRAYLEAGRGLAAAHAAA
jgi:eukaryotic-like serine/threonine-protein kinase